MTTITIATRNGIQRTDILPPPADLSGYFAHVARQVATRPVVEHATQVMRLMHALQRAGVNVAAMWPCLSEYAADLEFADVARCEACGAVADDCECGEVVK